MKYEIYCNQLTKRETKKDMRIHKYTIDKERDFFLKKKEEGEFINILLIKRGT
jgi:hypothetical protein